VTPASSAPELLGGTARYSALAGIATLQRALVFVFGISIAAPILLLPGQLQSPRLTDLMLLVMAVVAFPRTRRAQVFALIGLSVILLSWLVQTFSAQAWPDVAEVVFYARWLAAVVAAPGLVDMFQRQPRVLRTFLFGIVAGAALHVATFFLAAAGLRDLLTSVGLASPRAIVSWVAAQVRFTTMAEHPNAAMALVALAVPAALAASLVGRRLGTRSGGPLIAFAFVLLVAGFYFTLSRAALIASAVAVVFYLVARRDRVAAFTPLVLILVLGAVLLIVPGLGLEFDGSRYAGRVDSARLTQNLSERLLTWGPTLGVAISQPFGMGWSGYLESSPLVQMLRASHNGYLFTARTAGLPLALLLILGHLLALWRGVSAPYVPIATFILVAMFAEDLTQGASFVSVAAVVAALGWLGLTEKVAPRTGAI
jgi:hypothetical protein